MRVQACPDLYFSCISLSLAAGVAACPTTAACLIFCLLLLFAFVFFSLRSVCVAIVSEMKVLLAYDEDTEEEQEGDKAAVAKKDD